MTGEAAPRIERVSAPTNKRLLWILFIAPATWAVQEGLSTFVAVRACDLGRPALGRGLIIALGVAALAVTLGTSIAGHRALRRDNSGEPIRRVEGREAREMLALVAFVLGALLSCAVIWNALPSLFIAHLCEARR